MAGNLCLPRSGTAGKIENSQLGIFLTCAAAAPDFLTSAQVASTRFTIEQRIEEAKGETGLEHYEVRFWQGWSQHIMLWIAPRPVRRTDQCGGKELQPDNFHHTRLQLVPANT